MSSVDNRIVKMTFDNKQFQEGIQESLESLQRFEASLDTKELEKKFDLSPITKSLQHITSLFDPLAGAAERAFIRVTDAAVNAGAKMLKSLSVDNIAAGFEKFGQKTTSVGTLIAQGYDIDTVTEELERLNWFTDETSYNFTDMVENIGKFTASGKKLDESVTAMEGIATWAALSGQNASTASRAMYQISQAMGAGVMRREDFKSIQNASMDTQEFRQHALDAAVALKTLQKNADGTYQSLVEGAKVEKFTIDQFANNLTDGLWFTDEVMMRVFNDYSAGVGQIYDYTQETGGTASEAIEQMGDTVDKFGLKAFKAAQEARTFSDVIDSVKDAASTGFMNTFELLIGNYVEATKVYTDMANALYDVFAEPINQLNEFLDSVLSGENGKRTEFLETLANIGRSLIEIWNLVVESLRNVWEFNGFLPATVEQVKNIIDRIKEFTQSLVLSDNYLREKLEKTLTGVFSILHIGWSVIKRIGKYIGKAAKRLAPIVDIVLAFTAGVGDFFRILDNSISKIGFFNTFIGEGERVLVYAKIALDNFRRMLGVTFTENPKAKKFYEDHKAIFDGLYGLAKNVYEKIKEPLKKIPELLRTFVDNVQNIKFDFGFTFNKFKMPDMSAFWEYVNNFGNEIKNAGRNIVTLIDEYTGIDLYALIPPIPTSLPDLSGLVNWIATLKNNVVDALVKIAQYIHTAYTVFIEKTSAVPWLEILQGEYEKVRSKVKYIADNIKPIAKEMLHAYIAIIGVIELWNITRTHKAINGLINSVSTAIKNISGLFGLADTIKEFNKYVKTLRRTTAVKAYAQALMMFAGSIFIIAEAIYILTRINWSNTNAKAAVAIVAGIGIIVALIAHSISKTDFSGMAESSEKSADRMLKMGLSMLAIGIGVKILFSTLKDITKYFEEYKEADPQLIFASLSTLGLMVVGLGAVSALMAHWAPQFTKGAIGMIFAVVAIRMMIKPLEELTMFIDSLPNAGDIAILDMALQRIGALMLTLAAVAFIVGKGRMPLRTGIGAAIFAFVFTRALISLIKNIAKLDSSQLKNISDIIGMLDLTIAAISALIGVAGLVDALSEKTDMAAISKALRGVILNITLLVGTIGVIGTYGNYEQMKKVFIGTILMIGAIIATIGSLAWGANKNNTAMETATKAIYSVIAVVVALGLVVGILGGLMKYFDLTKEFGYAIGGILASFVVLVGGLIALSAYTTDAAKLQSIAISLLLASVAVGLIGLSLSAVAQHPWENILASMGAVVATLITLAAALGIIAGLPILSGDLIATAAALTIASVAIVAIGAAFGLMGDIDPSRIEQATDAFIRLFAAVAVVTLAIGAIATYVPGLAAGIVTVAIALLVVAAAIYLFAQAIKILIGEDDTLADVATDLDTHGEDAEGKIDYWSGRLDNAIAVFGAVIGKSWDRWKEETKSKAKLAWEGFGLTILEGYAAHNKNVELAKWNIEQKVHLFKDRISRIWKAGGVILKKSIEAFFKPALDKIEEIKETFRTLKMSIDEKGWLGTFAVGLGDTSGFWDKDTHDQGMKALYNYFGDVGMRMGESADKGFKDATKISSPSKVMMENGKYLVGGLVEGIQTSTPTAEKAAKKSAKDVIEASCDEFGVHSNSDKYINIGKYLVGGLVEGMEQKAAWANDVAEWLATQNITSFSDAIEKGKKYLSEKIKSMISAGQEAADNSGGIDLNGVLGELDVSSVSMDWENVLGDTSVDDYMRQLSGSSGALDIATLSVDDYTSSLNTADYSLGSITDAQHEWISELESDGPIIDKTTASINQLTDAYSDMGYSTQQVSENMEDYTQVLTKITDVSQGFYADKLAETVEDYVKLANADTEFAKDNSLMDFVEMRQNALGVQGMRGLLESIQDDWNAGIKMQVFTDKDMPFIDFVKERTRGFGTDKGYYENIHIVPIDPSMYVDKDGFVMTEAMMAQGVADGMTTAAQNGYGYSQINYTGHLNEIIKELSDTGDKITNIFERLDKLQVVLDTGVIAGAVSSDVDQYIGNKTVLAGRGVS